MHYLLFYDVVADYAERRMPLRSAHIAHARKAAPRGELVLGGAFAGPADGAVLLFRGSSPAQSRRRSPRPIRSSVSISTQQGIAKSV